MTDEINNETAGQLKAFVERIERLESEIKDLNDDKKEVYAEIKGHGFDAKVVKQIVAMRRQDADERAERETILEVYLRALGMS